MPASGSPVRSLHTIAEILSQPEIWRASQRELAGNAAFQAAIANAPSRKEWLFTGCGTSFYLAEAAAACWTLLTGRRAVALPASELLLFPRLSPQLNAKDLQVVAISRSGRTSETVRAAELLSSRYNLPTLGVTCADDSDLAKACQLTIELLTADEKSMVMTRSFTSMLMALLQIADSQAATLSLSSFFEPVASALSSRIQSVNERVESFVANREFADYIYLAQGPFYPIAREGALKITEMSCSYAQPYHTLEFRHGPKSVVTPQTCLTFFLSESGMEAESEVLVEMKELGGTIVAICNRAPKSVRAAADLLFELEANVTELALLAPFIVPAQFLGFYTGVKKGFNPDEPKNLSRVVILD
jgi:glucosamine--fructose-6-phosphate aminotransferase (isomerizing)